MISEGCGILLKPTARKSCIPVSGVETPSTVLGNYQCRPDYHKSDLYGGRVKRAGFNKKHEKRCVFCGCLFHIAFCFTGVFSPGEARSCTVTVRLRSRWSSDEVLCADESAERRSAVRPVARGKSVTTLLKPDSCRNARREPIRVLRGTAV